MLLWAAPDLIEKAREILIDILHDLSQGAGAFEHFSTAINTT